MLFDLRSPGRRNFIRVVYALLALLMGGGLILFGIGGGGSGGGLLDAIGLTDSSGGGSASSAFDEQISEAEKKAELTPQDPQAWLALARIRVSAGSAQVDTDPETGQQTPTTESAQEFERAADAWDRYLKLKPNKIDAGVAALIARAYVSLAETSTSAAEAVSNIEAAAEAQKVVAESMPSQGSLSQLAIYLYFSGDTAAADQAAKQAGTEAEPAQRAALKQQLAQFKESAAKFQQQVKAAENQAQQSQGQGAPGAPGGASPFENPLQSPGGGLGGGTISP